VEELPLGAGAGAHGRPNARRCRRIFSPSSDKLDANHPDLKQVEAELRAQVQRAVNSGLKIDYVDYHMGTVFDNPQFREIAERLAEEYRLGMMQYFGEPDTIPSTKPSRVGDGAGSYASAAWRGVLQLPHSDTGGEAQRDHRSRMRAQRSLHLYDKRVVPGDFSEVITRAAPFSC